MRTIIDLPAEQIDRLDTLAKERGRSRAAVIREVIDEHARFDQREQYLRVLQAVRGSWKGEFNEDAVAYQDRVRTEWSRD